MLLLSVHEEQPEPIQPEHEIKVRYKAEGTE
jgi:hypothetical protein